jgi:hypothetical protein
MMGTMLFTDHGILVFAMTTGAIAAAGWIQRRLYKPPA